jgi:hypothetical protein
MYYVSQLYEVQATLLDRPARGFIGFDQCYMVEGGELYNRKDIVVGEGIEVLWHTWAHRYDDGTVEAGHFALGHERFGFALFTNQDRQVVATTDIDGEVVRNDDGSVATIRANVAGEPWEFLPDPRGTMPDYGEVPNPQILGRWRRVGDNRTAISWLAWGETAPGHGDRPRR